MVANGEAYEPPELTRAVKRLEGSLTHVSDKLDANFVALNSEIRDVRHRVANLEASRDLNKYALDTMQRSIDEQEAEQAKVNSEVMAALKPMNDFLAEQAGIEKWKKASIALAGLIVAILGLVAGFVWAG